LIVIYDILTLENGDRFPRFI